MSKQDNYRRWTEKQVQAAINRALEDAPEGPNKDYWVTPGFTVEHVKAQYGLKKFKPEPLTITLVRECCGLEFHHRLVNKKKVKALKDYRCFNPRCLLKESVMPFGKFQGLAISEIYEQQPSYLAWFHETVEGFDEIKQAIRALDGIEEHLEAFRQRLQQPKRQTVKSLTPTQQQVEWLMGKFSSQTVDDVCLKLFSGEEEE